MAEHDVAPLGEIHRVANWEYADATARLAATGFLPSDLGKWAKQINDGSYWELTDDSPIVWARRTSVAFELIIAVSDETTALAAGVAKVTFRMPRSVTLSGVRASLTVAQSSGSILTVDINKDGTTILSTKITIDNNEKTSATAVAPPLISDSSLNDDAEITIDIDQIGDGTAKGLKITLIGIYT